MFQKNLRRLASMNKRRLIALGLICLGLVSCADSKELYDGDAYVAPIFKDNRYNHYDDGLKEAKLNPISKIDLTNGINKGQYFNGSGSYSKVSDCTGFNQAYSKNPKDFLNSKGEKLLWEPDIVNSKVGEWVDQSSLYDVAYGQTKKLARVSPSFRNGYLSKLYNGQVRCNAWSSYSLVELDESGYGTRFPLELADAKYFAFSARGGSDTTDSGKGRITTFDINVTFYKLDKDNNYTSYIFCLKEVKLQTNFSAEFTSLVGFYFDDIDFDPKGVVGMSIDYKLINDDTTYQTISNFDIESPNYVGIMLLEVFFPDSTWN